MRARYTSSRIGMGIFLAGALVSPIAVTGAFLHERGPADAADDEVLVWTAPIA